MMSRKFTKRETVLLVILALLLLFAVYYLVVWQAYSVGIGEAQIRQSDAESEYYDASVRAVKLNNMKKALEEMKTSGDDRAPIAEYDNTENVMQALSTALAGATNYSLSFSPVNFGDTLARRVINMTFTCAGYSEAKAILTKLHDCGYRCQLGNLGISAVAGDGGLPADIKSTPVSVSLSVTFFESYTAAEADAAADAATGQKAG